MTRTPAKAGRRAASAAACLLVLASGARGGAETATIDFEDSAPGAPPAAFSTATSDGGEPGRWIVDEDPSAPSGKRVLVQRSADPTGGRFPLCVYDRVSARDVAVTVRLKPISGAKDQAGGILWRYRDPDNYYVVRANALEGNVVLYKVERGKRTDLKPIGAGLLSYGKKVEVPSGRWSALRVEVRGSRFAVYLDGTHLFDVEDATFAGAGMVGLWTKADSVTAFDGLEIQSLDEAQDQTPREVLVVNTQAGSVSRVDLQGMREAGRFSVGERPYGIAVTRDGKTVAVGVEGEEKLKFFSVDGFAPLGEVRIGPMHNDHVVLSADGRFVLVANFHSDDVVAIDVASRSEAFRIEGASAPHVVKYGPLRKLAWVTCKKITGIASIDPEKRVLVKFHQTNVNPRSLTFSPDESRLYFASFWVDGFFEMDPEEGRVTRLIALPPPAEDAAPREVTYHGVEAVGDSLVLAANEGRSYLDAVDVSSGRLLGRLRDGISQPCCVERIPGSRPARALVSNLGDGSVAEVEVAESGALRVLGRVKVGQAPKRVAFLPVGGG